MNSFPNHAYNLQSSILRFIMDIYVVQNGDTIDSIANKFGVTVERLTRDNGFISTTKLVPGQSIVITYPVQMHTVQEGDSLTSIANTYGISVMQLLQYNTFLSEREYIYPGESLVISYSTKSDMVTQGFLYSYIDRGTLIKTLPLLSYLSVFNYRVTDDFEVITYGEDSDIIQLALDYGTVPILMISSISTQGRSNTELMYEILLNKELQNQLTSKIIDIIKTKGYLGLNVMVSGLTPTNQQLYVDFLNNIWAQLKNNNLYFYITINLNVRDTSQTTSRDKLDYTAISRYVDGIVFLQYYWGTNPGAPKPVNNIAHIKSYIEYIETLMSPDKIIIGLTLIGYDWELPYIPKVSKVSLLSLDGVILLANSVKATIQFDDISQTAYFYYTTSTQNGMINHIVWFIDARSINYLLDIVYEKDMLGSGIWGIMVFNQQLWSIICSQYHIIKYLTDNLR
jgi:spore germination protein